MERETTARGDEGGSPRADGASGRWPPYVCAIIEDGEARLLLEARPDNARLAAGQLTCFGGRREAAESPEEGLRRELREELGWEPATLDKRVELWVAGELVAWFYQAALDVGIEQLRVAPGHRAILVSRPELAGHPLSPWHRAVLQAWIDGRGEVALSE